MTFYQHCIILTQGFSLYLNSPTYNIRYFVKSTYTKSTFPHLFTILHVRSTMSSVCFLRMYLLRGPHLVLVLRSGWERQTWLIFHFLSSRESNWSSVCRWASGLDTPATWDITDHLDCHGGIILPQRRTWNVSAEPHLVSGAAFETEKKLNR